jgi:eukaryotic-like serine/threonine-protein kinase
MALSTARETVSASVGHYELRQFLGEGGFGRVYEAWDNVLYRRVAVKCLSALDNGIAKDALIREARAAASVRHLAFVKIFGFEDDGQAQYIIMELVDGKTLRHHAAAEPGDVAAVLDIVDQVAAAMAEAHASGLVHGDLKPGNLMVEPSGTVRILDFGLARHIDPLATQSASLGDQQGTIAYMAPERLAGRAPSVASDIYALGVILYELVTGERPFAGLHGLALASAQLQTDSDRWQYPADMEPGLLQLILAMTARDPARRLSSMSEVRKRIGRLRTVAPTRRRLAWRPPRKAWLGAAALLVAGAIVAVLGTGRLAVPVLPVFQPAASVALDAGLKALRSSDRDGAIEQALASFGAILERRPGHAGAAAGQALAYCLRYVGDGRDETWLRRAATAAALALRQDDQLALAHTAQAWVEALSGHGAAALAAADRALVLDPGDIFALDAKINVLLRMQRYPAAYDVIRTAQARWPNERRFADLEGTLLYQQGRYAEAEHAFRRSIRLEPEGVFGYANLSATLLRLGRADDALSVLQQGLRVQPSGVLYSNLGTVLYNKGDYLGAGAAFEHAVSAAKGGPNDYLKWANLADALRWIPGREHAAVDAYRRAVQLLRPQLARVPDDPTFLTRMGVYAAHLADEPDALAWTARGAALAPANPDVQFRAALAYELRGQRALALAHLEHAVKLGYPLAAVAAEPELTALRRDAHYQSLTMEHRN